MFNKQTIKRVLIILLVPILGTFINLFFSMVKVYRFRRNKLDILKWYLKFIVIFILMIIVLLPVFCIICKIYDTNLVLYTTLMIILGYMFVVGIGFISICVEQSIIKNREYNL